MNESQQDLISDPDIIPHVALDSFENKSISRGYKDPLMPGYVLCRGEYVNGYSNNNSISLLKGQPTDLPPAVTLSRSGETIMSLPNVKQDAGIRNRPKGAAVPPKRDSKDHYKLKGGSKLSEGFALLTNSGKKERLRAATKW